MVDKGSKPYCLKYFNKMINARLYARLYVVHEVNDMGYFNISTVV